MRTMILGILAFGVLAGCNAKGDLLSGTPPAKRGALGNGDFTFRCDDSVACDRWSNNAATFPDRVASGATFDLNYSLKTEGISLEIHVNETPEARGYRLEPVPPFASKRSAGVAAVKPRDPTVLVRDGKGWVVDHLPIPIRKPHGFCVLVVALP